MTTTRFLAASALFIAFAAQGDVAPTTNYSDIWYNADESGWGVTFTQHPATNQVYAVWYTYDPRVPDPASPGDFKPLWLVMPGGTWTTPTSITGDVYVTLGSPFGQRWDPGALALSKAGIFTFVFTSAEEGTFTFAIAPANGAPAAGLAAFSGSKRIVRQPF